MQVQVQVQVLLPGEGGRQGPRVHLRQQLQVSLRHQGDAARLPLQPGEVEVAVEWEEWEEEEEEEAAHLARSGRSLAPPGPRESTASPAGKGDHLQGGPLTTCPP